MRLDGERLLLTRTLELLAHAGRLLDLFTDFSTRQSRVILDAGAVRWSLTQKTTAGHFKPTLSASVDSFCVFTSNYHILLISAALGQSVA